MNMEQEESYTGFLHRLGHFRLTFNDCLIAAIILHIMALLIYAMKYHPNIIEVPFRTLHVKIGEMGESNTIITKPSPIKTDKKEPQTASKARPAVPVTMSSPITRVIKKPKKESRQVKKVEKLPVARPVEKAQKPVPETKKVPFEREMKKLSEIPKKPPSVASEQKNQQKGKNAESGSAVPVAKGTKLGNKKSAAQQSATSYEQLLSLWLARNRSYPEEAKRQKLEGYAIVRMQISRDGHIIYYDLIKKTGHDILDKATMDMVERSNPVPPIPDDYPASGTIQFDIPMKFEIQTKN